MGHAMGQFILPPDSAILVIEGTLKANILYYAHYALAEAVASAYRPLFSTPLLNAGISQAKVEQK